MKKQSGDLAKEPMRLSEGYHRSGKGSRYAKTDISEGTYLARDRSPRETTDERTQKTVGQRYTADTACDVNSRPGYDPNEAQYRQTNPSR